jgi:hypothetical protein
MEERWFVSVAYRYAIESREVSVEKTALVSFPVDW